jgi:hypothetical protein
MNCDAIGSLMVIQAACMDHVRADPAWQEALRRYRAHKDALKARQEKPTAPAAPRYCRMCCETGRKLAGEGVTFICRECAANVVTLLDHNADSEETVFEFE